MILLSYECYPGLKIPVPVLRIGIDFYQAQELWKDPDVDMPEWMVCLLDKEAKRTGVTIQSVIKYWLSEKLKETS